MQKEFDPLPRIQPNMYQSFNWPAGKKFPLVTRNTPLEVDIVNLIEQRQTRRSFTKPLSDTVLGDFLWLACRNRSIRTTPFGVNQESRAYPSAGAMHPIHVVISRDGEPWMRYDPVEHVLVELPDSIGSAVEGREAASHLLSLNEGLVCGLIAEPGKTAVKYENHESLVWRDAGVVFGFMSVIAEALGLAFCPLGITGQPYLTSYLAHDSKLHAVGLAVLGLE